MLPEPTLKIYRCFFDRFETEPPHPSKPLAPPVPPGKGQARAAAFKTDVHAWADTHLKEACADYGLGATPPLRIGPHGKPDLGGGFPLHFNLSHSGPTAALALSSAPVGIDLESSDGRHWEALSQRFFSQAEQDFIAGHAPEDRPQAFILLWTCKESLYKYIGCGLAQGLSRYMLQFDGTDGTDSTDDTNGADNAPATATATATARLPRLKKIRASYEARTLYFHSFQESCGRNTYRLTVCSPYLEADFLSETV